MNLSRFELNQNHFLNNLLKTYKPNQPGFIKSRMDEIYQKQPFLFSVMVGYKEDRFRKEYDEMIRDYLLIWEHFRTVRNLQKITPELYTEVENKTMVLVQNVVREPRGAFVTHALYTDLDTADARALWMA